MRHNLRGYVCSSTVPLTTFANLQPDIKQPAIMIFAQMIRVGKRVVWYQSPSSLLTLLDITFAPCQIERKDENRKMTVRFH